jgi:hypothetical protein
VTPGKLRLERQAVVVFDVEDTSIDFFYDQRVIVIVIIVILNNSSAVDVR